MNLFAWSGLILGLAIFPLGLFVFWKNKDSRVNQTLALFCFAGALWGFGGLIIALIPQSQPEIAMVWWKITHIGVIAMPIFLLHFIFELLELKRKKILTLFYTMGIFFLVADFATDLFIVNMKWVFDSFYWDSPAGLLYYPFVFFFFGSLIYGHIELYKGYTNSIGLKRIQIKYIFLAALFGFSGGGTAFLPCFGINLYPLLNLSTPLYPALIAYAIIRHRLMDIKLVLRRSSVYLASLLSIIIPAIGALYYFEKFFPEYIVFANLIIIILGVSAFPPLRNFYYRQANKYFFSSLYDSSEVIASLSDKLRSTLDLGKIYQYITETLSNAFHVKAIGILGYDEKNGYYNILFNNGFNTGGQNKFENNMGLHNLFISQGESLVVDEVKRLANKEYKQTLDLLSKLNIEVLTPLNIKDKTIGLIALGTKESKDIYNDEDLKVLKVVGSQAAIAIENALLFEETKNFGIKLKKEVDKATKDLLAANKQLKKLDATKSEFISIASHQLRTPLTVIKGYISMMLEGNFGKLTKKERESLGKVFESNERLINLVENLLNISRIESGRMQFNFEKTQFEKVVGSVMEELSGYAKRKKLRIDYKKPAEDLPLVKIDIEKIRQVIINLIDNAIKYTKQGGITVKIEKMEKSVRFSVSDSGIGIKAEDLQNLFKKFSRGKGMTLIHTEGTGLGLYVAKMMVEAHQGRIWAESGGEGKGSRFYFEIPII